MYKYIFTLLLLATSSLNLTHAYTFGMLSHDDTIESIQAIETKHKITLPMISFIRDEYGDQARGVMNRLPSTLGTGRVYHITLSPREHNAKQVSEGIHDWEYSLMFKHIKNSGIKVIFRTMHEMNGWWYPWSWNPTNFKKARIHIHKLSRQAGLDQSQILFDFSTNGWDMPPQDHAVPSQTTPLIKCTQWKKFNEWCLTREDYYPGDAYVDVMWVTFYNWGKATSNRAWISPKNIMEESEFGIWNRLISKGKPVIIDEVGTTSVRYDETYNRTKSLQYYQSDSGHALKNKRIAQLATRAASKSELVGLNYFNVDRTMWLAWENTGEADRSAIDLDYNRYYSSIMKLYAASDGKLSKLFITPEQKRKEGIGTWKKGMVKKKVVKASTINK
jgi:Glycosyl hydrolase family 26